MHSGMSSAETLPRISSDEEVSQESISFSDEKIINEVYIKDHKQNDNKKKAITIVLVAMSISFTAIVSTVMLLSGRNTSVYTDCGECTKILSIGGVSRQSHAKQLSILDIVEITNLDNDEISQECRLSLSNITIDDLPVGMVSLSGGLINDVPLVCGITANSSEPDSLFSDPTSLCYRFDTESIGWKLVPSMAFARLFSTSVVMDSGLTVIGGISQVIWILNTYVNDILYDRNVQILRETKKNATWQNKRFEGVIFGSCAVRLNSTTGALIGGGMSNRQGFFPTRKTWFFNLETEEWIQGPLLNQPRTAAACGVMRSAYSSKAPVIVIAGGQISRENIVHTNINLDHNVSNSVEILDFSKEILVWEKGPDLPVSVHSAQVVERSDGLYLVGGMSKNSTFDTIYHLPSDLSTFSSGWELINQRLKTSRAMHKSILVPDNLVDCYSSSVRVTENLNITYDI